ncbi:MAG: hypothetical protein WC373_00800 [Smithella sp.]|jgi:hypothetical protein
MKQESKDGGRWVNLDLKLSEISNILDLNIISKIRQTVFEAVLERIEKLKLQKIMCEWCSELCDKNESRYKVCTLKRVYKEGE